MSELHHECGVAAIYHLPGRGSSPLCPEQGPDEVSRLIPRMLLDIQNRGQLSAGMTSFNPAPQPADRHLQGTGRRQRGFPPEPSRQVRKPDAANTPAGRPSATSATPPAAPKTAAMPSRSSGTTCKSTSGSASPSTASWPTIRSCAQNLLADGDNHLARDTDTEIIMHEIGRELSGDRRPPLIEMMRDISQRFDGAYSLVLLNALGDMLVARDPLGLEPLCYAIEGPLFAAASESVALLNLGFAPESIKSLLPGQAVTITDGKLEIQRFAASPRRAHCFFEWIYFANVASTMDGRSVYLSRKALGEELARLETVPIDEDTIVVPVPDTSKAAADAMAFKLKVPSLEGLIRNRYTGRTFIEGIGQPQAQGRDQVHAAARSARRQAGDAGRGLDRPLDDDEGAAQPHSRAGPGPRDSRPRRLPADHRALLLRHRHVDDQRAVRAAVSQGRPADRRGPGRNGRVRWGPIRCAICRSNRSPGRSASIATSCARPASRANIRRRPARSCIRSL